MESSLPDGLVVFSSVLGNFCNPSALLWANGQILFEFSKASGLQWRESNSMENKHVFVFISFLSESYIS